MSSYYGRSADNISNVITLDNITFNGGTTYALTQNGVAFVPNNSSSILISIDGVVQQGNFSTNNSNIVFNFSPTSSNTCNWILHIGVGVAYVPAASSITKDKTNFVSTSSSPGLEIKGDGTTDGTLQLSCSQGSHGIKLRSPQHSTSSSYTLTFPGTDPAAGKMIQTDGSGNLSFVDAPSGGLVYVGGTSSTSEVSALTADNVFSSTYQNYLIVYGITVINGSNGRKLQARVRHGGTTVTASDYASVHGFIDTTTSAGGHNMSSTNSNGTDRITLGADAMSNSGNLKTCVGTLYCFDMNASDEFKTFVNDTTNLSWGAYYQRGTSGHAYKADQAIDGITFFADSDNLKSGYFRVYGIVNS